MVLGRSSKDVVYRKMGKSKYASEKELHKAIPKKMKKKAKKK